jgi:hypothetical protein
MANTSGSVYLVFSRPSSTQRRLPRIILFLGCCRTDYGCLDGDRSYRWNSAAIFTIFSLTPSRLVCRLVPTPMAKCCKYTSLSFIIQPFIILSCLRNMRYVSHGGVNCTP